MKIGRLFPDLLGTLGRAASPEAGIALALRQLVTLSGATAGGLVFRPPRGAPHRRDGRARGWAAAPTGGSRGAWPSPTARARGARRAARAAAGLARRGSRPS